MSNGNKYDPSFMAEYLYNRLPQVYRNYDNQELLKRFIDVFSEGGYTRVFNETQSIMDLLDVDKCPSKFLPLLCSFYGYEYNLEIPELFQRRLLKYIVDIYKRKGTKSSLKFIARELTGFESEIYENKDFDEEQIRITKWDKRFEHYRNFILKLTAPYEDSQLYNKEEIVVKIINNFLPTNSQVLVITAYWFLEEKDIVKNVVEDVFDIVNDYNEEVFKKEVIGESDSTSIVDTTYTFEWSQPGEEFSTLNMPPIGLQLFTNVVENMIDVVKFNLESYEKFLTITPAQETSKLSIVDEILSLSITNPYTETQRLYDRLNTESMDSYGDYTFTDKTSETPFEEGHTTDKGGTLSHFTKILDNLQTLSYLISGINETNCDIINLVSEETSGILDIPNDNSLLNKHSKLCTNGLHMFDIVREQGKEDKFIIL